MPEAATDAAYVRVFIRWYRQLLAQPVATIAVVATLTAFAAWQLRNFEFDASADTLVVEGDRNLSHYYDMLETFGESSFVVLTYSPRVGHLFDASHVSAIASLQARVAALEGVTGSYSMLDAPLLQSPPIPLDQLADGYTTLAAGTADAALAESELTSSPLFADWLVARDGRTAAVVAFLASDSELDSLRRRRDALRASADEDKDLTAELRQVEQAHSALSTAFAEQRATTIKEIRAIRDSLGSNATVHLGGVPMVAADMIDFVRADTVSFGAAIILLISLCLWAFFRLVRWVVIPVLATGIAVTLTTGALGLLGQPVTVVSSSFVPLVAIITISLSTHLVVRYRELRLERVELGQAELVMEVIRSKTAPCLYTAITTMVAFASLLTSGIRPVADFGWMMCLGIIIAFGTTFAFFSSSLVLLKKGEGSPTLGRQPAFTSWLRDITIAHPLRLLQAGVICIGVSLVGIAMLSLDNRFIDYFKEGTEIREGMRHIDTTLGGTIPIDVVLQFAPLSGSTQETMVDDPFASEAPVRYPEKYWFTADKLQTVEQLHTFLEERPEVGKVTSIASLERTGRSFNDGDPLDALQVLAILEYVPAAVRDALITPYASPAAGQLRVNARLRETHPDLDRPQLIRDIRAHLRDTLNVADEHIRITGMGVLFNDMLRQMVASQASTVGFVLIATFVMFAVLLRSLTLGLIGVAPNVIAPLAVLGFMGFAGIPLDIMTTIIAAVVIGVGVDDAIHYLHRFRDERLSGATVVEAVQRSHDSIGNAMYFTSLSVVCGFSVLGLSNFVPTVYFGLLTAIAMAFALIVNLTVLPALVLLVYEPRMRTIAA